MKPDDMPLHEVSPNIQELEPASSRKRSHDEFSDGLTAVASPPRASLAFTEVGNSSTPAHDSPASRTPTKASPGKESDSISNNSSSSSTSKEPSSTTTLSVILPVKRKRITGAEKEARDKEAAEQKKIRDQQLAEKAAIKAVEKAKLEEAKAARAKERDEKRRKKEEEQQRLQEEKDRKARSQKTLGSFFTIPSTPKKSDRGEVLVKGSSSPTKVDASVPSERAKSAYATMFQPFFVKENTRMAAPLVSQMKKETREQKSRALDDFIAHQKDGSLDFNPHDLFASSCQSTPPRGYWHRPVKHIMEWAYRESQKSGTAGAADATKIYDEVRAQLSKIPVKVIAFSRDVRPPYYGTATLQTLALGKGNVKRLARRSMSRRLPLNYDYDSEAEWQDEEEGEDLDLDDNDEEELDDEDDMDGFLDDSEDAGLLRRVFGNTMEPDSTGICFEDHNRIGPSATAYENKMEFMLECLNDQWSVDPFSTTYWEPETMPVRTKPVKAVKMDADSKMLVPPTPANAFVALHGSGSSGGLGVPGNSFNSSSAHGAQTKLVKAELLNDFKQAILNNKALSKVGIIDIIFHQFRDDVSRAEVKNTLEVVAEKKGTGRLKEWELKPGHEIVM